jgi:PadR family transcriptional regulator
MRILTNEAAVILALGEGPASGVGIMSRLRSRESGRPALGSGTLYPLVRRLEQRGLVRSWVEKERPGVGRPRRFLELTARGVAELDRVRQGLQIAGDGPAPVHRPLAGRRMSTNLRRAFRVSAFARQLRDAGTAS